MSGHVHKEEVPRGALIGALALILVTVVIASTARHANLVARASMPPVPAPIELLEARFEDVPDGSIRVIDAKSGELVSTIEPGTNNFVRGVLRGMFRGRKLESLGHQPPFALARGSDGRLTLTDPLTQRSVDLESFGPTNSAAFASLLSAGVARR